MAKVQIKFRVEQGEADLLAALAQKRGLSVDEYCRTRCLLDPDIYLSAALRRELAERPELTAESLATPYTEGQESE